MTEDTRLKRVLAVFDIDTYNDPCLLCPCNKRCENSDLPCSELLYKYIKEGVSK